MLQMVMWIWGICLSVCLVVITAAMQYYTAHFAAGAVVASFIAVSAIQEFNAARENEANIASLAAIVARYMGVLWIWAALAVLITYVFVHEWRPWSAVFGLLSVGGTLCMFVSSTLRRDASKKVVDDHIVDFVGTMAKVQFIATCVAIGGLVAFGKFGAGSFGGQQKWAAVNILLCTAMGLACLSGYALLSTRKPKLAAAATKSAAVAPSPPPIIRTTPRAHDNRRSSTAGRQQVRARTA